MQCYKRVMFTLCKTTQTYNIVTVTVKTAKLQLWHCCKNEMTHGKMFLQELCKGLIPQMPLRKHPAQKAYQICSKQQLWFPFEAWILHFPKCLLILFLYFEHPGFCSNLCAWVNNVCVLWWTAKLSMVNSSFSPTDQQRLAGWYETLLCR